MIGRHLLADLYQVAPERLDDPVLLEQCLEAAALECRLTPVAPPVLHRFSGGGITGFLLLAESHIAFHSYPEHGYLASRFIREIARMGGNVADMVPPPVAARLQEHFRS